jgi:hypothetical protein
MPITPVPLQQAPFEFRTPGSAMNTPLPPSPAPFPVKGNENSLAYNNASTATLQTAGPGVHYMPISGLNPYKPKWTIRAKIDSKQALKHTEIKGEVTSIMTVVLVDGEVCLISTANDRLSAN